MVENQKKAKNRIEMMEMMNPDAAGIDIGSEEHYVCVPADRDEQNVQKFSCFTSDLHRLADWLQKCHIKAVASRCRETRHLSLQLSAHSA